MKTLKILLITILSFLSFNANAQKTILGIANESKDINYYKEQGLLWRQTLNKEPKNANAWVNFYKAKRAYYQKENYKLWESNKENVFQKLKPVLNDLNKNLPNSFEYYWLTSINTVNKNEAFKLASKAYNIAPERHEVYEELLIHYMLNWETKMASEFAHKILKANVYANSIYQWNLNSLNSADKNSILITQGDLDTLPRWVLQTAKSIREDVLIVNAWLLAHEKEYRKGFFLKLGIEPFKKELSDFKNVEVYKNKLLIYLIQQIGKTKSIHFDCGTNVKLFETLGIKDKVYLTGMSFTYSDKPIDNLEITKRNFDEVLYLNYLFSDYQTHSQSSIVKTSFNIGYIPGLMKLKKHYTKTQNKRKASKYDGLITQILNDSGRKQEILSWYE